MSNFYGENYYSGSEAGFRQHVTKTYALMAGGLSLTFLAAVLTAQFLPGLIYSFKLAIILLAAELITVVLFGLMLNRAPYIAVVGMFFLYAVLTGVSTSYIFVFYDVTSIVLCFAAAAVSFTIMALIGHNTKRDLSAFGRLFFAGLVGLILLTIVGLFIGSSTLEIVISCIGLVLFLGITAFDTWRMKAAFNSGADSQMTRKFAVYFALELYLDFINIFMYLIRLLGRARD